MLMLNRFPYEYLFEENHMDDCLLREHEYYMHVAENMNNFNCPTHCFTAFMTTNIMFDKMRYKTIKMVRFFSSFLWIVVGSFFLLFLNYIMRVVRCVCATFIGFQNVLVQHKMVSRNHFQFLFAWPYITKNKNNNTLEYFFPFFFRITTWLWLWFPSTVIIHLCVAVCVCVCLFDLIQVNLFLLRIFSSLLASKTEMRVRRRKKSQHFQHIQK